MILLGLDPAFRENGFAVAMYDPADLFEPLRFVIFRNAGCFIGWLVNDAPVLAYACVENSNLDSAVYHLHNRMNARTAAAVGIRVGKNQAISQLAVDLLRNRYGKHNVLEVSPSKKGDEMGDCFIYCGSADSAFGEIRFDKKRAIAGARLQLHLA